MVVAKVRDKLRSSRDEVLVSHLRGAWFVGLLFYLIILSSPIHAATPAVKACAPAYLGPLEAVLQRHAMYSNIDGPIVSRALNHFMKRMDTYGTFFLEADHELMNPGSSELNNIRIQVDQQDYRHFQKILTRYRENLSRAQAYLEGVRDLRTKVIERMKSSTFSEQRERFDFVTPPKTIEEQNQKLIDYATSIYSDYISKNYEPNLAYLLTVRSMKREFESSIKYTSRPIHELALKSLMAGLDPHSTFLNVKEYAAYQASLESNFVGIGVIPTETVSGYSIQLMAESPAAKAGLRDNDIVTHVFSKDGQEISIRGKSSQYIYDLFEGPEGSQVTVKVRRGSEILKISITRETVNKDSNSLQAGVAEGPNGTKLGQIILPSFYRGADNHFGSVLKKMVEEVHIDGLLIDLRGNGGGSGPVTMNIMSLLIDGGPGALLNSFRSDVDQQIETKNIPSGNVLFRGPVVVLVDELSASASEFVALALRDYNRAIIVGAPRTFGKGTAQGLYKVEGPDGQLIGAVKVTESVYLGPRGTTPNLTGVLPDIRLREITRPHGVLFSFPDTTMPKINVPSQIPIFKAADARRAQTIAELSRLHKERQINQPPDPSMKPYEKEQNDAFLILADYIQLSAKP
jgi:carboxyl-terminal processing protease